jgi:hypothetical protein
LENVLTVTDNKQIFYDVAGRCPIAASVLSDPEGKRIALLYLDHQHTEKEIFSLANAGLNRIVGLVALNREGTLESVSQSGFIRAVSHATVVFAEAIQQGRREIAELERIAGLMDPRAQA